MEEAVIKRILPHSIEAEAAVVGAMLLNRDAILETTEILSGRISISRPMASSLMLWQNYIIWEGR